MSYEVLARKLRPMGFDALVGQAHVVRALRHALDAGRLHHAYMFTGTRGVGKTTTAMNLSHALALRGQRVLLMDLDSQANCTSGLGIEAEPMSSIYPVLLGEADIRSKFVTGGRENLTFVPSEMDLAGIEIELARSDDHLTRLRGILQGLKPNNLFEYFLRYYQRGRLSFA